MSCAPGDAVLVADQISAGYRGTPVLQDASVQITAGIRLVLMGANGSGKTTLLRCLSGAHRPSAGAVRLGERELTYGARALNAHRHHVQLVLQDPDDQLFSADVRADVSFGPMNLGCSREEVLSRVEKALHLLEITDLADRAVHQLSYGQRKRVAIAGAVAMRPDVLLLDEPTAGLDPQGVHQLIDTLARLEQAGTTVALATHDVDLAWQWATEVAVVGDQRVHQGPVADVLTDRELLARARLTVPWQVTLLQQLGVTFDRSAPPRTAAEVAVLLGRP